MRSLNQPAPLIYRPPRAGYLPGEVISARVQTIERGLLGKMSFQIMRSPGSGFAGQVYQVQPSLGWPADFPPFAAVKVLRPVAAWKLAFREVLFQISFQTTFAPRLREEAVRCGLLWQSILRSAAALEFGSSNVIAAPLGYYWDENLASFVELHEWIPNLTIRYEADDLLVMRWLRPSETRPSQTEMARKRRFMDRLAGLCREMGADGLARQFDWFTLVSQANVLTRVGDAQEEQSEFCAVDCRPGLAFPFFLPLSPAHVRICLQGLRRGLLVHFDECDLTRLNNYLKTRPELSVRVSPLVEQLRVNLDAYRNALPNLWQKGIQVLRDAALRRRLRAAMVEDWTRLGLTAREKRQSLVENAAVFSGLWVLCMIPLAGSVLVRLAANPAYQQHTAQILRNSSYQSMWLNVSLSRDLAEWAAAGRISGDHSLRLRGHTSAYLAEKIFLSWLPVGMHRFLTNTRARQKFLDANLFQPLRLLAHQSARIIWLESILQFEYERGVVTAERAAALRDQTRQPQMQGFIRDLGFSAGLDVFSRLVYLILGLYAVSTGDLLPLGIAALSPIPPSGPLRVIYVLALLANDLQKLIRRKHVPRAGRLILARFGALLVAPWRGIGNLFAVMEMSAYYPRLSLLLADYYIEQAVNCIPVLGGRGKLLEYWAFQACYNIPMSFKRVFRELLPHQADAVDEHAYLSEQDPHQNDSHDQI